MIRADKQSNIKRSLLGLAIITGLTGCTGGDELNTESAVYTPENKPLGVVAQDNAEVQPGATVNLTARLVGTVSGQQLRWEQISGATINLSSNVGDSITFTTNADVAADLIEFEVVAVDANGDVVRDENNQVISDTVAVTVIDASLAITLDVADGELVGTTIQSPTDEQYVAGANDDTHTGDLEPGNKVVYTLNDKQGFFTLYLRYLIPSDYGGKVGNVKVNGVSNMIELSATGQWEEIRVGTIKLEEGENIIEVGGGWNYYRVDEVSLIPAVPPAAPLPVEPSLTNDNASIAANNLMKFLAENYTTRTISGQTEFPNGSGDFHALSQAQLVINATGDDAPGIVAFDYMRYSPTRNDNPGSMTEDMIQHYQENNIILSPLCHWNAPSGNTDPSKGFYADSTDFDLAAALADKDSSAYAALISDMDLIAVELKKFADKDIPLLWRPLHEADGDWFWWSVSGPDALIELWRIMYDRYTNHHGLNNLIWVFSHSDRLNDAYYPGDDVVDIVGFDGYDGNNDKNPFVTQFKRLKRLFDGKKILALTETGTIPDVKQMHDNQVWWSYFVTWNSGNDPLYGPANADPSVIDANYDYEGVLNRDEIPGSQPPVGPGMYENFDGNTGFEFQADWSAARASAAGAGVSASSQWAGEGVQSLRAKLNVSAVTDWGDFPSTVIQTYPEGGIDASSLVTLKLRANASGAGPACTAKLFVKHGNDWVWVDAGAQSITDGGVELSIDVSGYDWLAGFGVQFEGFDLTATDASFSIDEVTLVDSSANTTVIHDFEQAPADYHAQWDWSTTSGLGVSDTWSTEGEKALTFVKDLSSRDSWGDFPSTVIQIYPEGGIEVSASSMLTIDANVLDAGVGATAKLFIKHGPDWLWVDSGAQPTGDDGIELSIDLSGYDWIAGYGIQFEGFDTASTNAKFLMDNVRIDDSQLDNFEQTGQWQGQADWANTPGATLTEMWGVNGTKSLVFNMDLSAKTDWGDFPSTVLQNYPEVNIKDVSTLRITANAIDAGAGVTAKLFIKHGEEWTWVDSGAQAIPEGGAVLEIDVSQYSFLAGWGVQFEGFDTSSADAKFFVDNVEFIE